MNKSAKILYVLTLLNIALVTTVISGEFLPGKVWKSGDTLTAADLNTVVTALQTAVNDNDTRTAALELDLSDTKAALVAANGKITDQGNALIAANDKITLLEGKTAAISDDTTTLTITGRNVQIVSGSGTTNGAINGKGNLIVGYNEHGGTTRTRTGSHNLVIGREHTYTSYGGLVAGIRNTISGVNSSVSGGLDHTASNYGSSVSGGIGNTASGYISSVSGGSGNTASGDYSSVSGGRVNTASGYYSSVSGGNGCDIGATDYKWIVGNIAAGCDATSVQNK